MEISIISYKSVWELRQSNELYFVLAEKATLEKEYSEVFRTHSEIVGYHSQVLSFINEFRDPGLCVRSFLDQYSYWHTEAEYILDVVTNFNDLVLKLRVKVNEKEISRIAVLADNLKTVQYLDQERDSAKVITLEKSIIDMQAHIASLKTTRP